MACPRIQYRAVLGFNDKLTIFRNQALAWVEQSSIGVLFFATMINYIFTRRWSSVKFNCQVTAIQMVYSTNKRQWQWRKLKTKAEVKGWKKNHLNLRNWLGAGTVFVKPHTVCPEVCNVRLVCPIRQTDWSN